MSCRSRGPSPSVAGWASCGSSSAGSGPGGGGAGRGAPGASAGGAPGLFCWVHLWPPRSGGGAERLDAAELAMMERDDETAQMRYAAALAEWGDAGGYDAEVLWDACC